MNTIRTSTVFAWYTVSKITESAILNITVISCLFQLNLVHNTLMAMAS